MTDDAERFAVIDAVRVAPFIGQFRNKRADDSRKRYLRQLPNYSLMVAACGCIGGAPAGGICIRCQGAVLTGEERKR